MATRKKATAKKTSASAKEEYFVLDHTRESVVYGPHSNEENAVNAALEDGVVGTEGEGCSITVVKVVSRYAMKFELIKL